jgi:DNA-binding MarR family transcriptional regulator
MLSRMVPKLEEAGLLSREVGSVDRRVCLITATEKARTLLARVRSEREDALSRLLEELDEPERRALAAATPTLEKLAERLRNPAPPAGARAPGRVAK